MRRLLIVIICSGVYAGIYTQKAGRVINIVYIPDVRYAPSSLT